MSESRSTESVSEHVHLVQRRSVPAPFGLWGWLATAALVALCAFSLFFVPRAWIQHRVHSDVTRAVDVAGMDWIHVTTSGQSVLLEGTEPEAGAGAAAIQMVRGVTSDTWLGALVSPMWVNAKFSDPVAVKPVPASWAFTRSASGVELSGRVGGPEARHVVQKAAESLAGRAPTGKLDLGATDPAGSAPAAQLGMDLLKLCLSGRVAASDGALSVHCEVADAAAETALRASAKSGSAGVEVTDVEILVRADADSCDAGLAALLKKPIRFESGKAEIVPASIPHLAEIAKVAASCPGRLKIEGHTDNRGGAKPNRRLSLSRANAVRSALINHGAAGARLTATGLGEADPIADNGTAAGRAANRRIEIEVVRPGHP